MSEIIKTFNQTMGGTVATLTLSKSKFSATQAPTSSNWVLFDGQTMRTVVSNEAEARRWITDQQHERTADKKEAARERKAERDAAKQAANPGGNRD